MSSWEPKGRGIIGITGETFNYKNITVDQRGASTLVTLIEVASIPIHGPTLAENQDIFLGSVGRRRYAFAMEATNTRFETAHSLHLLLCKGRGKDLSSHIRTGKDRWQTPTDQIGHLNKPRPDLPVNRLGTMGAEFMSCERRKRRMLLML